ncbi:MAG: acyl-CoA dehydrogenase family protein [Deltaproteobacteria bacterium]|nr:acyl-CoA dehydrogenase family protein [Deltaproteobacteria bacterium]
MEILHYSEDHNHFRKRLRVFLDQEIKPHVQKWEKDKIVPKDAWKKMGGEGFLCTGVSKNYGGIDGDFLYSVIVIEELSKISESGLAASLHSDIIVPYIDSYASDDLKQKYLPGCVSGDIITALAMTEPDAGSDLASMKTTATAEGDEIIIEGSKTFISNGINSDLVIVAARDPMVENVHNAISLYLVEADTPGFEKGRQLDKMGLWSQDTSELFFNKCRIPKSNLIGEKGSGFIMLMEKLQQERLVCAVMGIVAAEIIMEITVEFCRNAKEAGKPITRSQAVQFTIVEMETEVRLGRTFLNKVIADHMEKKQVIIETSMAKYWGTDLARKTAEKSLDLYGQFGTLEKCPAVKGFRDVRVMSIFAGTNEIMKGIIAKFMGL